MPTPNQPLPTSFKETSLSFHLVMQAIDAIPKTLDGALLAEALVLSLRIPTVLSEFIEKQIQEPNLSKGLTAAFVVATCSMYALQKDERERFEGKTETNKAKIRAKL